MPNKNQYHHEVLNQLKAEVFCAELLSKGFSFDDIIVTHKGAFRKSYRNDIGAVTVLTDEMDEANNTQLLLDLNRDSIYDRLPEGLFHQTRGNSNTKGTTEMVAEYRRYRNEEKQARKYFQPFDQEIFRYATMVEQMEQDLSFSMLDGDIRNELTLFWNLEKDLPKEPVSTLLRILPWVYKIKGNMELTTKALESMLGKTVTCLQSFKPMKHEVAQTLSLGEGALGIDTLNGTFFEETVIEWEFSIENLSKKEMVLYPPWGAYGKFLRQFEEIFIPLSVDVSYNFDIDQQTDSNVEEVLGFSMVI